MKETTNSYYKSDVYALGLTFLCMKKLLSFEDIGSRYNVEKEKSLLMNETTKSSIVILKMLQNDPEERATFKEIYDKIFAEECEQPSENPNINTILRSRKQTGSKSFEDKAKNNYEKAMLYKKLGNYEKTIEFFKQAIDLYKTIKDKYKANQIQYKMGFFLFKNIFIYRFFFISEKENNTFLNKKIIKEFFN